ncbi:hypothetical protein AB6A40_002961 [Gnathostoma spinigerum]|uniref:Pepsin inhibitor-3-like repeated domain-containing protein n=1 Tax=Gnathostoma spinigerum TaxID=75299 RepID=A0ABD6EI55_9BILA
MLLLTVLLIGAVTSFEQTRSDSYVQSTSTTIIKRNGGECKVVDNVLFVNGTKVRNLTTEEEKELEDYRLDLERQLATGFSKVSHESAWFEFPK